MKVGLGVVLSGRYENDVPTPWMWSMWKLHSAIWRGVTPIRDLVLIKSYKFPTSIARNQICQTALDEGVDRLVFIDVDHDFEPEAITRLLSHDLDIVTARYHVKQPPHHPNLYMVPRGAHSEGEYKTVHYGRGVFEIDRCGAGGLAIKREVLESLGFPWFQYEVDPHPPHDLAVSEDFYFCRKAQEAGFAIHADWDATMQHLVQASVGEEERKVYLGGMEREIEAGSDHLVDQVVVRGYPDGYTLSNGVTIKDYCDDSVRDPS